MSYLYGMEMIMLQISALKRKITLRLLYQRVGDSRICSLSARSHCCPRMKRIWLDERIQAIICTYSNQMYDNDVSEISSYMYM